MDLTPLLNAPPAIQVHVATVVPAALLGAYQLAMPKGTPSHRTIGYIFLTLMALTSVAAFFIRDPNGFHGFTWIHLFIPLTAFGIVAGLWNIKHGNIPGHRRAMVGMYIGAILIAGTLAFTPGRIMHHLVFGS